MLPLIVFALLTAPQDPKDVTGWHGATWGMTIEQVKAATGMTLEPTTDHSGGECKQGTPGATLSKATTPIDVGSLQATARFCVTDKDGLVYINLDFGAESGRFGTIRDELAGSYGPPTSEQHDPPGRAPIAMNSARWVFPKTQISVSSVRASGLDGLSVTYSRRKPVL